MARSLYLSAWHLTGTAAGETRAWLANQIGFLYRQDGKYDSALFFYRHAGSIAKEGNHHAEEIDAYKGIAESFQKLSSRDSAHFYLQKAIVIAQDRKFYDLEASLYSTSGNIYRDENRLQESLSDYIKSATFYDSLVSDPFGLSKVLANIANIHNMLRNHDKALEYLAQSTEIAEEHSFERGLAYNHQLAGRIYRTKNELPKALQEYQQALSAYEKIGDKYIMVEVFLGIGNIYYDMGNFQKALLQYKKGLALAKEISAKMLMAYNYSAMGYAHYSLKNRTLSSAYMDSTRVVATQTKNFNLVMDAYEILAAVEQEQQHFKKALDYTERFIRIKDSLTTNQNRTAIQEIEAKYESNKKNAAIALLKKDQEIQGAALQRGKIIIVGVTGALLAAIAIGVLLLNRSRLISETKRQVEIERMRNQIARDLHDDIGSTLSSINIISQVALKDEKTAAIHFQRIHDHSARIMENMSDIVWSIHPGNDSMERVIVRMKEFCGEILEPKDIRYDFENMDMLSGPTLDIEARKNLFLVFKEIINNAAKYSKADHVKISLNRNRLAWRMDISDNGIGFEPLTNTSGNGLNNIRRRAEAMGATVNIITSPGKGTRLVMEVKDIT